jgi:hypothetical protein
MNAKQSQVCPKCAIYMDFVKYNTWLKCPICAYMVKVEKIIVKAKKK